MTTQTTVARAVRFSLLAFVSTSIAPIAMAAEQGAVDADKVERIAVTGSRIQRTDMETSSPVTVISRAEIDASGTATVSDFVRNLSQNSFGSFREASGFGSGQSSQSTVSMRGLGSQRTLVLIDGRRMGSSVAFGGGTQNLNVVPMAAIERIEVLRDGASAVYGSDAVAGVINIITKKEFEGVEFDADLGATQHGGAEKSNARFTFGVNGEKTNMVASVEYYNRAALYDADRDYSDTLYSAHGWPGTGSYVDKTKPILDADGKPTGKYQTVSFADERCGEGNSLVTGPDGNQTCSYNAAAESATMAAQERFSTFVKVDHELTEDINWTNRLMMSRVWTEGQYAAAPNSYAPKLRWTKENSDIYLATVNKYGNDYLKSQLKYDTEGNLIGGDTINLRMRTTPLGPRVTNVEDTDINFLTSLEGHSDILGGTAWNLGAQWIRSDVTTIQTGLANANMIQEFLDNGKLDYFAAGTGYVEGSNELQLQEAAHTGIFTGRVQTYGIDGGASFDLFELPAGTVPLAIGFEFMRTEYDKTNDAGSNLGNIIGTSGGDNIQGKSREVLSFSAETMFPIIDGLDLELSARFDDYSDFGSTFNPKVGLSYRPVDSLLVRASYGTGFRAPTFDDLYATASETYLWAKDWTQCPGNPNGCVQEQFKAQYQGNDDLEPEESTSLSLGLVWNVTDALDFEISYYDIQIDSVISTMSTQDVINQERDGFDMSNVLFRDPVTGKIDYVVLQKMNLGELKTSGIDFNIRYLLETSMGDFRFGAETNYVLSWESKDGPYSELEDIVGDVGQPQFRANLSTTWTQGEWEASLFARYTDSQEDEDYGKTPSQWLLDAQAGYNLPWNAKVNVGIRNLLDEEPAMNENLGFPGYDTYLYDPIGREYYVRYNQKF
ncbi:TonB-dependent receptor [Shewanella sp. DNRA4]|uniref:TonB-dependent receptor plug domain-containing protein n=1 Tax=Shewanella sp. DNRA4 TaxID=2723055 RepID=UPI00146BF33D|nr:TonB-dependent receptor [Shewanella sp. DNRA4]NMD51744.1 TonB-dependent receptor [Shewanella sp. DNRA4]